MRDSGAALRIGFLGAGFMAQFHLRSLLGVRNAVAAGVVSATPARREAFAAAADASGLGPCTAFAEPRGDAELRTRSTRSGSPSPNHTRLDAMREIHAARREGRTSVFAVACEKPLARTLAEAREMLRLAEDAGLLHGYLENQLFSTAVQRGRDIIWRRAVPNTGRPYLARATEEHSGPHEPWFWDGRAPGRRRALRHDVPLGRGRPLPAHRARRAARPAEARQRQRARSPR